MQNIDYAAEFKLLNIKKTIAIKNFNTYALNLILICICSSHLTSYVVITTAHI